MVSSAESTACYLVMSNKLLKNEKWGVKLSSLKTVLDTEKDTMRNFHILNFTNIISGCIIWPPFLPLHNFDSIRINVEYCTPKTCKMRIEQCLYRLLAIFRNFSDFRMSASQTGRLVLFALYIHYMAALMCQRLIRKQAKIKSYAT